MTGARFIMPAELERLMPMIEKGECLLLDIRSSAEYRTGHIASAMLMPVEELEKRAEELDRRKPLVIYCRTGKRCLRVLPLLTGGDQGELLILEGGLERWPGRLVSD
ncbi:MAG TPA: rhodanese-like domain-containing protein [Methanomassiliicoccales archaeon]|jgi:rhodanese-related sulfurtransferase